MTDYSIVSRSTGLFLHFEVPNGPFRHLNTVIMSLLSSPDKTPLLPSTINHTMGFNFSHYSNCLPSFGHTSPPTKGWPHRVEHDPLCDLASWTITFPVLTIAYGSCITLLTHVKRKAHRNYSLSFLAWSTDDVSHLSSTLYSELRPRLLSLF